jgi:hypothetical protein
MTVENDSVKNDSEGCRSKKGNVKNNGGSSGILGAAYFMAFIGAAIYYIQQSSTFWEGVLGFLKAIVWPGMMVFDLFKYLNM